MSRFISYRQKMRYISVICVLMVIVLALVLTYLISHYKNEAIKRSENLFKLDEEQYAAMKEKLEEDEADSVPQSQSEKYNFYEKLALHLQVNVLFLGDEIMSGAGVSDDSDNWVNLIVGAIENECGSDVKGGDYSRPETNPFYGYHIMNSYSRGLKYDLMVVCYGGNEPPEVFSIYYDGLLRSIKRQNPKCEIYCIIAADRNGYGENAENMRSLCEFYGGICIDMNKYFEDKRINYGSVLSGDNIPNVTGCTKYFDAIYSVIKSGLKNERSVPTKIKANTETSKLFDTYQFTAAKDMNRVSDKVYEFTTTGTIAGLVYYKTYFGGNIRVYVNGKRVLTESNKFDTNITRQVRCLMISNNLSGVSKIRIETDSADNMTNIFGVAVCGIAD